MPAGKSTKSSTARRNEAYVDTSALIAFADRSDSHHSLFRRLFSDPPPLLTTPLVVAEGHGWFLRRYDAAKGLQFLSMVETMPLHMASVGEREQRAAFALIRIVPISHGSDQDDELRALAGQGKIRLAEDELDEAFWDLPAPRVPVDTLRRVLIRERDETTVGLL